MKCLCKMVALSAVVLLACTSAVQASIVVGGEYQLGESDAGAADGLAGAATTINDGITPGADLTKVVLSGFGPAYTSNVAASAAYSAGSTLAMDFSGTGYYIGASPAQTSSIAIEGWFKVANLNQQALAYNGNSWLNGLGLYLIGGHVQGIGGGGGFGLIDTGFTPTLGEWFYAAVAVDNGTASVYVNSRAPAATLAGTIAFPDNQFSIGVAGSSAQGFADPLSGAADHVRVLAFNPGAFNASQDLLYAVPEPAAMVMLLTGVFGMIAYAWRKRR